MAKKRQKSMSEDELAELIGQYSLHQPAEDQPDLIGIGRNGITYIFQVKPLGEELPEDMDFAEQLREIIRESGVSQLQLAKQAGVPQPAISNFMSGRDIKLQTYNRLALIMGVETTHKRRQMPKTKAPAKKKPAQ